MPEKVTTQVAFRGRASASRFSPSRLWGKVGMGVGVPALLGENCARTAPTPALPQKGRE